MIKVSALHKTHDAEKNPHRPPFRFSRAFLSDQNQRSSVVFQFPVAIRALIRIHEITEFNTAVGTFEFFHFCYLVENFLVLGLVFFWFV